MIWKEGSFEPMSLLLLNLAMKEASRMMVSQQREFQTTAELMDPGKNAATVRR